jgi:hypothetical protein
LVACACEIKLAGAPIAAKYPMSAAVHPAAALSAAMGSSVALAMASMASVTPELAMVVAALIVPDDMPTA